jgi:predicted nuclease of predicted toxin-antitoxin system
LLNPIFPGTSHVLLHGLDTAADSAIWEFGGFVILTKDEDFQILSFIHGHPPKVIWLHSGNGPTEQLLAVVKQYRQIIEEFGDDADRSLLTLP